MPVSNRLQKMMKGWGKNRNTKPLNNTLIHLAASKLSANDIMKILKYDPVLLKNTRKAIEHRAANINSLRSFMLNYHRKKYMY